MIINYKNCKNIFSLNESELDLIGKLIYCDKAAKSGFINHVLMT